MLASWLRKALVRSLRPALILAVAILIPVGAYFGYGYAVTSPYFAVKTIEVSGLEQVERARLLEQAALAPGMNIFDVDSARHETLAKQNPWVAEITVTRSFPAQVEVSIRERQLAAVVVTDEYVLVESSGRAFKVLNAEDSPELLMEYPLITGLSADDLETSDGRERVRQALELYASYDDYEFAKAHSISEVHVDPTMGLSVVTRTQGTEIRLGVGRMNERLDRLEAVFKSLDEEALEADYILLDQEEDLDRVVVGPRSFARKDASDEKGTAR